ncbi:MAG: sigma-70 family RNA polymerase sigma factor [Bacillota bacterium]
MDTLQLCSLAIKGDSDAFYKLMCEHKTQLYKIAYAYFKNEQDALEAVQETTVRALLNIRKLKQPKYFKTWLIRILINYCIDEKKNKAKEAEYVLSMRDLSSGDEQIEFRLLVEQLDTKYKSIIILKYFEGFTLSDISEIMDKPLGTVKTWLNQALKKLRIMLSEEGECNVR